MNNINTGQLMEYTMKIVRLLCYQNEVFSSVFQSVPNFLIRTQKPILLHLGGIMGHLHDVTYFLSK